VRTSVRGCGTWPWRLLPIFYAPPQCFEVNRKIAMIVVSAWPSRPVERENFRFARQAGATHIVATC